MLQYILYMYILHVLSIAILLHTYNQCTDLQEQCYRRCGAIQQDSLQTWRKAGSLYRYQIRSLCW